VLRAQLGVSKVKNGWPYALSGFMTTNAVRYRSGHAAAKRELRASRTEEEAVEANVLDALRRALDLDQQQPVEVLGNVGDREGRRGRRCLAPDRTFGA
jgi:hypothetical protein